MMGKIVGYDDVVHANSCTGNGQARFIQIKTINNIICCASSAESVLLNNPIILLQIIISIMEVRMM